MAEKLSVIVTGEHDFTGSSVVLSDGRIVEWKELQLLNFEPLPIEKEFFTQTESKPYHWIIFSSPRSVRFWTDALLENAFSFPVETQVATIGESTGIAAQEQGYTPDFYPTEPGSECFIEEFKQLLSNSLEKPRVLIPQAAKGRPYLREQLEALGCQVTVLPLYKTSPVEDVPGDVDFENAALLLFTSPSSFQAFKKHFRLPKRTRIGSIGKYTFDHLLKDGVPSDMLPGGEFDRIGEILC